MFKYEIILYWSNADGAFVAEVPGAPWLHGARGHAGSRTHARQPSDETLDRYGARVRRSCTGTQGRAADAGVRRAGRGRHADMTVSRNTSEWMRQLDQELP